MAETDLQIRVGGGGGGRSSRRAQFGLKIRGPNSKDYSNMFVSQASQKHNAHGFRGAHVSQSGAPSGIPSGFNVTASPP